MNALLRSGLQLGLTFAALSLAVSCQSSTSPEPTAPTGNLTLSISLSDTALVPDAIAWSLKGSPQAEPAFTTSEGKVEITLPTTSIGNDTATLELSRFGIRTHTLHAWTKSPPRLTAKPSSDTAGIRVLKNYLAWKASGHQNRSLLDYLATSIVDGSFTQSERTRIALDWTASSLDSAALLDAVRRGYALDSLLPRWSGALSRDQAISRISAWKAAGTITTAQHDAMLPPATQNPPKDNTPPVIALIGAVGDGYVVDTDTARIVFTVSDASPLQSVKAGSETLTPIGGRFEFLVQDLVSETPRLVELIALDTPGNEARKTVTVSRRASTTLDIAGLPDSVRFPEDSSRNLAFQSLCPAGSECVLSVRSGDTSLVTPTISTSTSGSTLKLAPAPDRNGTTTLSVELRAGSRSVVTTVVVVVTPVNDAPALEVVRSLSGKPSDTARFASWLVSSRPGPSNESGQELTYLVRADSAANLLAGDPTIDARGRLVVVGKGISGTVVLSVRARDDGDSLAPHANTSPSQRIVLRLDSPPTLTAPASITGKEDTRLDLGLIKVEDLESSADLDFSWNLLDETLLPRSDVRIRTAAGGYTIDVLPAPNRFGKTRIAFHVKDPAGSEVFDTTEIEILPVNDSPMIAAASGLPDTIVIPCTSSDTTLPKLFGDIVWEPGTSTQTGTWTIALADTAQVKFFYYSWSKDGIQPLENGGVRMQIKIDTTMLVRLVVTATDDGGTENGGVNTGRRTILVKYTNTVKDVDGNVYTYRRMPDGKVWMTSNLYTRPTNGDIAYVCAGAELITPEGGSQKPDCRMRGALYNWGTAMGQSMSCDTSKTCQLSIPKPARGLCPEGWHVAEREEWSTLLWATSPSSENPGATIDSSVNLRSPTTDWGQWYRGWSSYPAGTGKFGNFLVPTNKPFGCGGGIGIEKNAANYWLPHVPFGSDSPASGGTAIAFYDGAIFLSGRCSGSTVRGVAAIRCLHDSR